MSVCRQYFPALQKKSAYSPLPEMSLPTAETGKAMGHPDNTGILGVYSDSRNGEIPVTEGYYDDNR